MPYVLVLCACFCVLIPPQTQEEVTGNAEVSRGLGPLLGHLVFRRHKSHEIHRFLSPLQRPLFYSHGTEVISRAAAIVCIIDLLTAPDKMH